jgi:hypothetical protein
MAKQTINVGTTAGDGTGDTPRAGGQKINANFTEVYDAIAALEALLASDETDLDELQEIVDFIQLNRTDLDALSIASIAGLQAALDAKQTALVSGTTIKTVNGSSLLGSGDLEVTGGTSETGVTQQLQRKLQRIANGDEHAVKIMTIGDSLAAGAWPTCTARIMQALKSWLPSSLYYAEGGSLLGARTGQFSSSDGATRVQRTDYDVSYIGIATRYNTGQSSTWAYGNNMIYADEILIPIVTEPGAGKVKIEISDGGYSLGTATYRDIVSDDITSGHTLTSGELIIDADAAKGLDTVKLSVALDDYVVRITHESGSEVRVLDLQFSVVSAAAINLYRIGAGGNAFRNSLASANSIMSDFLDQYDPDLLIIESDDGPVDYENFLPMLSDALEACTTAAPTVLLVGNPGIGSGGGVSESDLADRIAYCKTFGESRRWDTLDGLEIAGGYAALVEFGIQGDGIHLTPDAWNLIADKWINRNGLQKYTPRIPGGDVASTQDVLDKTSDRLVRARDLQVIGAGVRVIDSGTMDWGYHVEEAGAGTRNPGSIHVESGSTANGSASAFIGEINNPIGVDKGLFAQTTNVSMACAVRVPAAMSANSEIWITMAGRSSQTQYYGSLTAAGYGWRIKNGEIHGVRWTNSLQLTPDSVDLNPGTSAKWHYLLIVSKNLSGVSQELSFYVDQTLIGVQTYNAFGVGLPLRFEVENGGDSSNCQLDFLPPRYSF